MYPPSAQEMREYHNMKNSQWISDEGHLTLRIVGACFALALAVLFIAIGVTKNTEADAKAQVIETCVKHPVTKTVRVQ
jgi:hypothetical protein